MSVLVFRQEQKRVKRLLIAKKLIVIQWCGKKIYSVELKKRILETLRFGVVKRFCTTKAKP
jgi:hypothetical protein